MSRQSPAATARRLLLLAALALAAAAAPPAVLRAQPGADLAELKRKAAELVRQTRYTEALPLLEKLAAAEPGDAGVHFELGFALIAQALNTKDEAARRALRVRALASFVRAKELGVREPVVDAIIASLPADGSEGSFSLSAEADKHMREGEALYGRGELDGALKSYQRALRLDPTLYFAALFSGDVYLKRGDFAQAEAWYRRAIEIDPTKETAYRYSATPFMRQRRYDEARDRYVEAYITEPYNQYSVAGLRLWAQTTGTRLANPSIDVPTRVAFDEKGDAKIDLDASALLSGKVDDGSFAWLAYGTTRAAWRKEKFAKVFPGEKGYRHSLAEEAEALRGVLAAAAGDKRTRRLADSLARLKRLDEEGLLEAYILLARADEGIARDHPAYLKQNRDKLRRYVVEYVLKGGGRD